MGVRLYVKCKGSVAMDICRATQADYEMYKKLTELRNFLCTSEATRRPVEDQSQEPEFLLYQLEEQFPGAATLAHLKSEGLGRFNAREFGFECETHGDIPGSRKQVIIEILIDHENCTLKLERLSGVLRNIDKVSLYYC